MKVEVGRDLFARPPTLIPRTPPPQRGNFRFAACSFVAHQITTDSPRRIRARTRSKGERTPHAGQSDGRKGNAGQTERDTLPRTGLSMFAAIITFLRGRGPAKKTRADSPSVGPHKGTPRSPSPARAARGAGRGSRKNARNCTTPRSHDRTQRAERTPPAAKAPRQGSAHSPLFSLTAAG